MPSNENAVKLVAQIKEQVAEMETQLNGLQIPEAVLAHIHSELQDVLEHSKSAVAFIKMLGDEISPDTCRFWDSKTGEKLDKDRFRRDLGNIEDAYKEVLHRLTGEVIC